MASVSEFTKICQDEEGKGSQMAAAHLPPKNIASVHPLSMWSIQQDIVKSRGFMIKYEDFLLLNRGSGGKMADIHFVFGNV